MQTFKLELSIEFYNESAIMKTLTSLSLCLLISLTACSQSKSFSTKTFEAVTSIADAEKLREEKCSNLLEFEKVSLEQRCWSFKINSIDEGGKVGLDFGIKLSEMHNSELEIIEKSDYGITARKKTNGDCAQYVVVNFENLGPLQAQTLPADAKIIVAASKDQHCDKLSKPYKILKT